MATPDSLLGEPELLALLDSASQLNARIELRDVLTHMVALAGELSESAAGSVILHDPARNDLYFAAVTGPSADDLLEMRIPVDKGKAGQVFATGVPLIENSLDTDTGHYKAVDQKTEFTTRSMICVPLAHEDRKLGVMQILNKRNGTEPYTQRDLELLSRFAVQASVAIRNASLFEQMLASSGLYGEPDVRREFLAGATAWGVPAKKERLTVVFADMRGFNQLCRAVVSPERIQRVLSEFLGALSAQVVQHQGIVNKFLGDGLMAIFRGTDGARNAVHAAFAMADAFDQLKPTWDAESNVSLDFLDLGVGITTDEVILGTIGDDSVRDFTVIGQTVNLAAGLEKMARDGKRVLCDNLTYRATESILGDFEGPLAYTDPTPHASADHTYKIYHLGGLRVTAEGPRLFVSYAHEDRDWVERNVVVPLRDHHVQVFFSDDTIRPADLWEETIGRELDACEWFVVVLSKESIASRWVHTEVSYALNRDELGGRIIPIMMEPVNPVDLNWRLHEIQYLDFTDAEAIHFDEMLSLILGQAGQAAAGS